MSNQASRLQIVDVISPLHSLTWVFGEQTAQAGESPDYNSYPGKSKH
jgi:hypothetical protein